MVCLLCVVYCVLCVCVCVNAEQTGRETEQGSKGRTHTGTRNEQESYKEINIINKFIFALVDWDFLEPGKTVCSSWSGCMLHK